MAPKSKAAEDDEEVSDSEEEGGKGIPLAGTVTATISHPGATILTTLHALSTTTCALVWVQVSVLAVVSALAVVVEAVEAVEAPSTCPSKPL